MSRAQATRYLVYSTCLSSAKARALLPMFQQQSEAFPPLYVARAPVSKEPQQGIGNKKNKRERAYSMLLQCKSNTKIQRLTTVSTGIFSQIKYSHLNNNQKTLNKLLDPENHTAGAPPLLSRYIELRIRSRIKEAASRGFVVDVDGIRDVAARCAEECGK